MEQLDSRRILVVDIQLFATALSILSFFFTFFLIYNLKLIEEQKEPIISKELTLQLISLNRIFIFLIVLIFLDANLRQLSIDKEEGNNLIYDYLSLFSSFLTIVVAGIAIYNALKAIETQNLNIDISNSPF